MNVEDAAYETVHSYPGGSAALGPRVGINPTVLNSKVNPNTSTHHLTLTEARRIVGTSGNHSILHAWAAEEGFVLVPIGCAQDGNILAAALRAEAAKGNLARLLHEALQDGKVTENEARGLMSAGTDAQAAVVKLLACAQAMVPKAGQGG